SLLICWFFPVNKKDPTILPRHTRIEGVAASNSRKFLVTTSLPAFTPRKGPENGPKHVPHEVTIGEVLTKVGVIKGDPAGGGSASPSALVQRSRQSLRCVDESQHEVIIPFNHRALLFDVAENYGRSLGSQNSLKNAPGGGGCEVRGGSVGELQNETPGPSVPGVVSTCTVVNAGNSCLPRVFRHVLGDPPALTEVFTGLLRCYSVFTEETVMAATMSRTNLASYAEVSSCLELATDSAARFNIALNASDLKKTNQYNAALRTCEEQAPSYVRAIKTSFTVQPVVSDLEDVDFSLYESLKPVKTHSYTSLSGDSASDTDAGDKAVGSGEGDYVNIASLNRKTVDGETAPPDDCNESVTTDDLDYASAVETTSVSDAQSCDIASMSDVVEVEANSEFDISWGQLRRARSFTGSISSENSDSSHSQTIHSDSEESEDSMVVKDDNSSISQDSFINMDDNSSTSQDTVVLRQSRVPSTQGPAYANDPGSARDDDTVSEVSSFGEADIDSVFRVPQEALANASSSGTLGGDMEGEVRWEGDEQQIWWGDGSAVSTIERPRTSWSSHFDPGDTLPEKTQKRNSGSSAKTRSQLPPGGSGEFDTEVPMLQSAVNGRDSSAGKRTTIDSTVHNGSGTDSLTQPYLEIPRRSRVQSLPHTSAQQPHPGLSTFTSFKPKSASTSKVNELSKDSRSRHSESDPNIIREKDEDSGEGQIDLEFVKSLGEKLLAVSKRSSTPKYQRLETEREFVGTATMDDHRQRVTKSNGNSTHFVKSDRSSYVNTNDLPRAVDAEVSVQRTPSKHDVLLEEFDLLQEEVV
ncbi:hypothetical protein BaRGS_00013729, partial [Batillaria attramentaria]